MTNDLDAFVDIPQTITLTNGQTLEIKPLTWKQELQLIKLIGDFISKVSQEKKVSIESFSMLETGQLLGLIFKYAPDLLTQATSIIIRRPASFIEENLTLDDIIKIVFPFFGNILQKLLGTMTQTVQKITTIQNKAIPNT